MNKNEFFEAVKNGVLENLKKTDDTPEATINKVTKINNVIYTGLSFKSQATRVAPVVYLDEFFSRFSDDDLSLDEVIERVSAKYKSHAADSQDTSTMEICWNWFRLRNCQWRQVQKMT